MSSSRRLAGVLLGLLLAIALLGGAVRILLAPAYTRTLVIAADAPALTGLSAEQTLSLAEEVRAYVVGTPDATLPATLADGRPAFDEKAVAHLDDVRDVMDGARAATVVAGVLAAAGFGVLAWRRNDAVFTLALRVAGLALAGLVILALLVGLLDFDRLFAGFHELFFEAGTWQFAADALLIRIFPEPFWAASGVAWGVLLLAAAAACGLFSRFVGRRFESADG